MNRSLHIDPSWHPLARGHAPAWASEWGEDRYGVFAAFTLGETTQRLRWVPAGRFRMGSPDSETKGLAQGEYRRARFTREHPQHDVYITRGFWLFDTPCTQALWEAVMGNNPSRFQSPERPLEGVSWEDVERFLAAVNERVLGLQLCLPTEAQWEHACRAGTDTALYTGAMEILGERNAPALDTIAWYGGNSGEGYDLEEGEDSSSWPEMQYPNPKSGTRPVGLKAPNPWGLYDMLGNVWEWCADGERTYDGHWQQDPVGHSSVGAGADAGRVVRGGAWSSPAQNCRSANRRRGDPVYRVDDLGFRCARVQA